MSKFLHRHPTLEKKLKLDKDHVIVHRTDWEQIKALGNWIPSGSSTYTVPHKMTLISVGSVYQPKSYALDHEVVIEAKTFFQIEIEEGHPVGVWYQGEFIKVKEKK